MSNCLYNGVELHALPPEGTNQKSEWDKEAFPYAYIYYDTDFERYYLETSSAKPIYSTAEACLYFSTGGSYRMFSQLDGRWWNNTGTDTFSAGASGLPLPIWSNFDILDESGNVVLAASAPIPVGGFVPDPTSMTLGWWVGRRIAGQRSKGATE